MEYLILMTIAGSALCLAYVGWGKLFHKSLTQCMRYRALKFTLLAYVVPWVWLKDIYSYVIRWLLPVRVPVMIGHPVAMADIITEEEAYTTHDYKWQMLVIAVWMVVALIMVIRRTMDYVHQKNRLLSVAVEIKEGPVKETLEGLRKELHCLRKVRIYRTPLKGEIFTLGAIRPIIFLQEDYTGDQLYFILRHEMIHVVRKDLVVKLIMEFACCLHWFNYLVYALNKRFDKVCEYSCDEKVLKGHPKEVGQAYARLLADHFGKNRKDTETRIKIPFQSGLDNDLDEMMERLKLLVDAKEIKGWRKRLTGCVFILMLVFNSFMALAYPDVYHVEDSDVMLAEAIVDGDTFWVHDGMEIENYGYEEWLADVFYDSEFIDEEGNICPVDSYSSYVFCVEHDIVSGRFQSHIKNSNDECEVIIYQSTKCKICDAIWIGEKLHTGTWVKCIH